MNMMNIQPIFIALTKIQGEFILLFLLFGVGVIITFITKPRRYWGNDQERANQHDSYVDYNHDDTDFDSDND